MVNLACIPLFLAAAAFWHLFLLYVSPALGLCKPNFRQEIIPASYGIIILGYILCGLAFISVFWHKPDYPVVLLALAAAFMSILGWLDDLFGSRTASGFKGHFKLLFRGKVTTGAVKAIGGGLCGAIVGYFVSDGNIVKWISTAILIPLAANSINLLDLRPGRAAGVVLVGLLLLCPFMFIAGAATVWILGFAVVLAFAIPDGMAKLMMGDSGANQLGAYLGVCAALYTPIYLQIALIIFMVCLQVYSEKHSVTALIDNNPALRKIDRMLGVR